MTTSNNFTARLMLGDRAITSDGIPQVWCVEGVPRPSDRAFSLLEPGPYLDAVAHGAQHVDAMTTPGSNVQVNHSEW